MPQKMLKSIASNEGTVKYPFQSVATVPLENKIC